jgi:polysaccharide export outer membrane protein
MSLPSRFSLTALFLVALSGCGHVGAFVWAEEFIDTPPAPELYRVVEGDRLQVSVWSQQQISGEYAVRNDGNITIPLVGDVAVLGLALPGVAEMLTRKLDGLVVDPKVTVALVNVRPQVVSVLGEVRTPGQYPLDPRATVLEVLAKAGGLTAFADPDSIYVVRRDAGAVRVRFSLERMTRQQSVATAFRLRDGDVVVVE